MNTALGLSVDAARPRLQPRLARCWRGMRMCLGLACAALFLHCIPVRAQAPAAGPVASQPAGAPPAAEAPAVQHHPGKDAPADHTVAIIVGLGVLVLLLVVAACIWLPGKIGRRSSNGDIPSGWSASTFAAGGAAEAAAEAGSPGGNGPSNDW